MANFITILRIFLVFISAYLLLQDNTLAYYWALALVIIAFSFDGLDGYIARKFNESSKLGAMLDIMGDRIAENTYWVMLAILGLLPASFPIIVLTRSFIVDGLRSVAMEQGYTAFGEKSMQSDKVGYFICSSKFTRITYAVAKAVAFVFLIASAIPNLGCLKSNIFYIIGAYASIISIIFCTLRGMPVIFESKKLFKKD